MKFEKLLKNLEVYCLSSSIIYDSDITGIKLLEENQRIFLEDILYIGYFSSLDCTLASKANMFLIRDCNKVIEKEGNIALFKDISISSLFNQVQDIFIAQSKKMEKEAVLLHSLIEGKDLKFIIKLCCEILKNPVLLTDSSLKLIEYGYYKEKEIEDKLWNDIVTKGYCSYEFVAKFKENKIPDRINNTSIPLLIQEDFSKDIRRVIGSVKLKGKNIAYLAVLEYDNVFTNEDLDIIRLLCEGLSTELKQDKRISTTKGMLYESLLYDLIEGSIKDISIINDRLKYADWKAGERFKLIVVDLNTTNEKNHYIDYLRSFVEDIFAFSKTIYYEGKLIILVELDKCEEMYATAKFKEFLQSSGFTGGISTEFSSLIELKDKYYQSKRAIEIGQNLYEKSVLYEYEKLKLYDLLKTASEKLNLIEFCPSPLIRLNNYDKQNNTDYMNTLKTYLYCNKNKAEAAKKLFLHRNTLNYRLNKIREITAIEFEDFKEQYYLYLGFKIIKLEGSKPVV